MLTVHGTQLNNAGKESDKADQTEKTAANGESSPSVLQQIWPSICIIGFFNLMPIVFIVVLRRLRPRLHEEGVKKKIGNMYSTVDPKYTGSLYYNVVFLTRRSLYVLITYSLFNYPGIQIQSFIYVTLLYLIYLHHFPVFVEKLTLKVETFNEVIFLLICYHMVLFSNLIWLPELKQAIGKSLVTLVFSLLGVNTLVIIFVSLRNVIRTRRLKYLKSVQSEHIRQKTIACEVIAIAHQLNTNFVKMRGQHLYEAVKKQLEDEQVSIEDKLVRDLR